MLESTVSSRTTCRLLRRPSVHCSTSSSRLKWTGLKTKSKGTSASCKIVKILDYLSECSDEDFAIRWLIRICVCVCVCVHTHLTRLLVQLVHLYMFDQLNPI